MCHQMKRIMWWIDGWLYSFGVQLGLRCSVRQLKVWSEANFNNSENKLCLRIQFPWVIEFDSQFVFNQGFASNLTKQVVKRTVDLSIWNGHKGCCKKTLQVKFSFAISGLHSIKTLNLLSLTPIIRGVGTKISKF